MSPDDERAHDERSDRIDQETVAERLRSIEQYLEYLGESNPYYEWLETEVQSVERGTVRLRQPHTERVRPPEVGPSEGINGGVLMTIADAAGMAAVLAEVLEPVPLATTGVNLSFHSGVDEAHIVTAETVDLGSTLATTRLTIVPESDSDAADPQVIASGEATARLFE